MELAGKMRSGIALRAEVFSKPRPTKDVSKMLGTTCLYAT